MEMPRENGGGLTELARRIDGAVTGYKPGDLLDRLPESGASVREITLSGPTIASVVEAARCLRMATEAERFAAPELAMRLERHPETRARMLIVNHCRYRTWGLVEELMTRSRDAVFGGDPPRGVRLARLAASVADHLDPALYGTSLAADLRARAWGNLGNAYRCASQLRAAAAAMRHADDLLLEGTGDPLETANLLSLRASLTIALGDVHGMEQLLDQALAIYEDLGEVELSAKTLVQKASAYGYRDPERALEFSLRAEGLIDPVEDARLFLMARHNRIVWMIESGRLAEAERVFATSRSLYLAFSDSWTALHLAWTEARLTFALGEHEDAERRFQALFERLLEEDQELDAACCALELSACRLARGDTRGASELAATMAHHLRDWGAHAHAREAWALLQHYLSLEKATEGLARELAVYLRRAWQNPHLAFQPRLDP